MKPTYISAPAWMLLLLLFMPVSNSMPHASATETASAPGVSITFDQSQGVLFSEWVNLSGTSTAPLRETAWSIVNISGSTPITVLEGPYLTAVRPVGEGAYTWELSVNVGPVECTCYIELEMTDEGVPSTSTTHIIYVGQGHHRPVFLDEAYATGQSPLDRVSPLVVNDVEVVELPLVLPASGSSSLQAFGTICEAPFEVCLDAPLRQSLPFSFIDQTMLVELNASRMGLHEGIWRVDVSATDELLRSSQNVRLSLIHDTTAPNIEITAPDAPLESEPFNVFANGDDGYDGSAFFVTWVLTDPNGQSRAPLPDERESNTHLILAYASSGVYRIEATVRDLAGNTVTVYADAQVLNLQPRAAISVDNLLITNEVPILLGPDHQWSLNANASIDNEPIDYLWVINNSTSIRGIPSLVRENFDRAGSYSVELIVFDDDGATDTQRVNVIIVDPTSVSVESPLTHPALVGFFLLLIFAITVLLVRQRKEGESELPKWRPVMHEVSPPHLIQGDGVDATIEEDEARG